MKRTKYLILLFFLVYAGLPAAASGQAQGELSHYQVVEIERFTIQEGVEFPESDLNKLMTYLVLHF